MKKILSVLLALLIFASTFSVAVFAAPEPFPDTYTIRFAISDKYDGTGAITNYTEVIIPKNSPLLSEIAVTKEYDSFVVEEDGKQVKYYFAGWRDADTGKVRTSNRIPKATCDKTYVAVFEADNSAEEGMTLLGLIAWIFARFNRILDYFEQIFSFELG